jgi:hypothetical protein
LQAEEGREPWRAGDASQPQEKVSSASSPAVGDGVPSYAHAHELVAALEAAAAAEAAVSAMASRLEQAERRATAAEARATEAEVAAEVAAAAHTEDVRALEALVASTYASPAAGQRQPDDTRQAEKEEEEEEEERRTKEGRLATELETAKHALATQGAQQQALVASLRSQVRALEVQLHAAALEAAEEKAAEAAEAEQKTIAVGTLAFAPCLWLLALWCHRHPQPTYASPV